jgi:hypothetical protein
MNSRARLFFFFFFVFGAFLVKPVVASDFQLTKIGSVDTAGARYTDWWYTGTRPTLSGTADSNVEIVIDIGEDTYSTSSDGDGNWSYRISLESGDYDITITHANNDSYSFTLHLGQSLPANVGGAQSTESTSSVPDTGFNQFVGVTLSVGVLLLGLYLYFWGHPKKHLALEKRVIQEE